MQLLCLGDIAINEIQGPEEAWNAPIDVGAQDDKKVLFNWELPLGGAINPAPRTSGPRLLSHPKAVNAISHWAPSFATLATNHILDAGVDGLAETITTLQQAGFQTIGAGMNQEEISRAILWDTKDGCLAMINWVFPEAEPDWMKVPGANCWPGVEAARSMISSLKEKVDWVLVCAHWSDDNFPYPRPGDRVIARELAEAGADIVVSHHPHVVRGMEVIGSCPVFYSLGNFYFSDFSDSRGKWIVKWAPRNREGLGIQISFQRGSRPQYKALSYLQTGGRVGSDPLKRAGRRMRSVSQPLARWHGKEYEDWYAAKRAHFDRIWARWHFGVRRLGFGGSVRYVLQALQSHDHD